jgi:hypothetical protein
MIAFENDWAFLRAALPELQGYILSKDVYRLLGQPVRIPGSIQIPQLTIGNLLLSQARLAAHYPVEARSPELAEISQKIEQERASWRVNWANKAGREYTSRLNLWNQYLRELRGDPRAHAAFYANEVRHRTILNLLAAETLDEVPQNEAKQLNLLDGILSGLTQTGPFVWEPGVESAFPSEAFWFLYRSVRK